MPVATWSAPQLEPDTIAACQRGDRDAFRLLFEAYKDKVYSLAYYFSGNEAAARDIAQEVFLKLFTRIGQFRGDANFSTWLYRLVANASVDAQRKSRRWVPLEASADLHIRHPQEEHYFRRQVADAVKAALDRLQPKLRWPLVLRYVEGLSYEEIGSVLGCTSGTVASRLNRGHKILARKLAHLRGKLDRGH